MGELLEKYVEMTEKQLKTTLEIEKVAEPVKEPGGAQKRILISEDAEPAASKLRGTKRKRYARTNNTSRLDDLPAVATKWITRIKRIVSNQRVKYLIPKSVPKPMQQTLAKSPTHPQSSLQNQPIRVLFLNRLYAQPWAHRRNPIYRILSHL